MQGPERKFVGGIKNIDLKNAYEREKSNYQDGEVFGLNHDFGNQSGYFYNAIELYNYVQDEKTKKEILGELLDYTKKLKTYTEWIKQNGVTPEKDPAVFASDIAPYIESLDEIVLEMKQIGAEMRTEYDESGKSKKFDELLLLLLNRSSTMGDILKPSIENHVGMYAEEHDLTTRPAIKKWRKQDILADDIAAAKIKEKLDYGRSLLEKGPLEGSSSYIRKDGNVLPVDWEPTEQEEQKLKDSRKKTENGT